MQNQLCVYVLFAFKCSVLITRTFAPMFCIVRVVCWDLAFLSINALCPPDRLPILSFAVAEVDFSSTPVQLTALRAVQPADAPLIYDVRH